MPSIGTPSTTYNGSALAPIPKVATPLIRTLGDAPGCPSVVIETPATRPCIICVTSLVACFVISSVSKRLTEPVKSDFL